MPICYVNPDPRFQPAMRLIGAITNAFPAAVTTTIDHDYQSGTIVRFYTTPSVGMTQINGMTGTITVTGADTFIVNIDAGKFDVFAIPIAPQWYDNICALVVPVGQVSTQVSQATRDVT